MLRRSDAFRARFRAGGGGVRQGPALRPRAAATVMMRVRRDARRERSMFSRNWIGALLLALLVAAPALAQLSTATIEVVVTDGDGGALPGVAVSLENVETGFRRQSVTGENGGATLAALPPGT